MAGVNKVIIVGNLGADPEVKNFDNGGSLTNISVATSDRWTDKQTGEQREATEWHRIVLNNRLGEIAAQYLRKGSKVYIEGSLRTRKWQDQNGQDRYTTEIRAQSMQMLDSAGSNNMGAQQGGQGQSFNNQNYNQAPAANVGYQNNQSQQNQQSFQSTPSVANSAPQGNEGQAPNNAPAAQQIEDDDLPF